MRTFLLLLVGGALVAGCGDDPLHFPPPQSAFNQPQAQFNIPPRELFTQVKQTITSPPISLPIAQQQNGTITTGYKDYPGAWHIARRWQERTRYRLSVVPDFDNPAGRSELTVSQETQTRATDGQKWTPATDVNRTERATELLKQIEQQLPSAPATRP